MSEKDPLFQSRGPFGESVEQAPIYREKHREKYVKVVLLTFFILMGIMVGITIILTSVQSFRVTPLNILLLINILGVAQLPIFLTYFIYTDRLSTKMFWSIFAAGGVLFVQALGTDIIVFTIKNK